MSSRSHMLSSKFNSTYAAEIETSLMNEEGFNQSKTVHEEMWVEPEKSVFDLEKLMKDAEPDPTRCYNFHFIFCFKRKKFLSADRFLTLFFNVEMVVSCATMVGSLVAIFYGMTFFSVDPSYDRDNQLIGLVGGFTGLTFSLFKFYFTLVSLKNLKKEVFVAEISCAAGLAILTHVILLLVSLSILALTVFVALDYFKEGKSRKTDEEQLEWIMAWVLMIISFPMFVLVLALVSQSMLMCQISNAADAYMIEYIHSSKVRKELDEERKKQQAKDLLAQGENHPLKN